MENQTVSGLRSRSRSKTPFLRSSCDHENCTEGEEHTHVSGRKTPIKKSQNKQSKLSKTSETIQEEEDRRTSSSAHRTRQSMRSEKVIKTSDYSSDESPKEYGQEVLQSTQYERVSSNSRRQEALPDVSLSPIQNVTHDRSTRFGSPAYSACSTDSSFTEQVLADTKALLDQDPSSNLDNLPYRLYKMAGEYWNKYPKTDFTYSPLSKDRVELAPGRVAMPNMSRRSLISYHQGRSVSGHDYLQGRSVSGHDEIDRMSSTTAWSSSDFRKRLSAAVDSSDDEYIHGNGGNHQQDRWWAKKNASSLYTSSDANSRYPYTGRDSPNIFKRTASKAGAMMYWIYTVITTVVTTTVTTVTETISPSNISSKYRQLARSSSRKWPWLLLLLLPILGYGCYNYGEQYLPQEKPINFETHKTLEVVRDAELIKRMEALENWAISVDNKLKAFDTKIKSFTDQQFVTKDQMERFSQSMYDRLLESLKSNIDEDRIRLILQEYLSVFERRQMEVIIQKVTEHVKEIEIRRETGGFDAEAVRKIVASMLEVYDADKIGMVDFALESAGGQVISTKCTELYQIKTKQYSVLGLPIWWVYTSPRHALTAGAMPADCWAFQAFPGYLVVRLYAIIEVTGFTIEHMSKLLAANGKIESAPKNFSVYGLHDEVDQDPHLFGNYMYDANGTSNQFFPVQYQKTTNIGGKQYPVAFDIVELRVESNHGNPTYTCVYRFRVHGNPLSDIRSATEDSIRDSEYS